MIAIKSGYDKIRSRTVCESRFKYKGREIMKTSIRKQFALITIGLLVGTLLICCFINIFFLEKYYEADKIESIRNVYGKLNTASVENRFGDEEFQEEMLEYAVRYNVRAYVISSNAQSVMAIPFSDLELRQKLYDYMLKRPIGLLEGSYPEPNTIFKVMDIQNQSESLEIYGRLENGYGFIISSKMESIQDSVKLANRFLAYVGTASVLLGSIILWAVAKRFTKPILELADISEKMTRLDFEAKYAGKDKNEIALLGKNINQLSLELEKTISELKTANNELKKDIEKKEKIDEMRKEFLSNVSHELKTPIALIRGYAEGLMEGINDDKESRDFYCEVIMDEACKMNNMVKKLMTLNQLEFGNDMVSMERFDIAALVQNYIQSASILTKQNNIEVRMAQLEPIYVWGDEFKIEEVFMNYFSNAVNHCSGKKIIDVTIEKMDENVRISVFNTGDPIPEASVEHIWEKFYKVDKARTREYGGSGVGLSIVKAIMDSLNQKYGVTNYTNGVRFWFELELVKEEIKE